ncbi:hypothetical protein DRQ36_08330 [bacterium]|nr:MAG: hypothetical protein DRQ36_08330 [bacterium]
MRLFLILSLIVSFLAFSWCFAIEEEGSGDFGGTDFATSPVCGDIDGDGHIEIIFGDGSGNLRVFTSTTADNYHPDPSLDPLNDRPIVDDWPSDINFVGSPAIANLEGEGGGNVEIIVYYGNSGASNTGRIGVFSLNLDTHILESFVSIPGFSEPHKQGTYHFNDYGPAIGDVNGDDIGDICLWCPTSGKALFCINGATVYDSSPEIWSSADGSTPYLTEIPSGAVYSKVSCVDFDGDGKCEIVCAKAGYYSAGFHSYPSGLMIFSVSPGTEVLEINGRHDDSGAPGPQVFCGGDFAIANLDCDDDDLPELVTVEYIHGVAGKLHVYSLMSSGPSETVWDYKGHYPFPEGCWSSSPAIANIFNLDSEDESVPDVAVGTPEAIYVFDGLSLLSPATATPQWSIPASSLWDYGEFDNPDFALTDFDANGLAEITVISDWWGPIIIDCSTSPPNIWNPTSSGPWIYIRENEHSHIIADVDGDGHAEIVIPGGSSRDIHIVSAPEWAPCRNIWNQMSYYPTHLDKDFNLTDYQPWVSVNMWRAQCSPTWGVRVSPEEGECADFD